MIAHFRPFLIIFLGLCLGIWLTNAFKCFNYIFIFIILGVLVLAFGISFLFLKFKNKLFGYLWKTKWVVLTLIVSVTLGMGLFVIDSNIKNKVTFEIDSRDTYTVIARLETAPSMNKGSVYSIIVDHIAAVDENGKVAEIKESIYVTVKDVNSDKNEELKKLKTGDIVTFTANIKNILPYGEDRVNAYYIKHNVKYYSYVSNSEIFVTEVSEYTLIDKAQLVIKNALYANMDEKYAGLAYGILIGDTSGITEDTVENFRITGIAHLLAVSGLNVVFIITLLMPFFKLIRLKPVIRVIVIVIILAIYCVLCNLTASVLRASLMAVFALLGTLFGKQNDSLNSVSLAGILIVLVTPWSVFDLSFILSFVCVFAIIFLYPIFYDALRKLKLGNFVSSTLAVSIASQIGVLPFMINSFGYVSTVNLLANFVIVPILGYVYMFMFLALILTLLFPFMGFLLWLCQWGYWFLDVSSAWFASIPYAQVAVASVSIITTLILMISLFIFSRNFVVKDKIRVYMSVGCLMLLVTSFVLDLVYVGWWL